ncbi:heterokaryon incompatibility protein-domain-containing protein [Fusarium redolens]|uniref:Heterokaryon incompatibility protein-domain-containing protein n=1 Tax=Fusarium redolens TaxID=48865 RepID=A0A9P9G7B6_FUSRE|nr:heterokaryon incompatibility protein-domain-containing protein [Fusarium redolens]KAH7233736.1 heterokaryon incompatibility protein-domain-containing protein [Fusarium redolens]
MDGPTIPDLTLHQRDATSLCRKCSQITLERLQEPPTSQSRNDLDSNKPNGFHHYQQWEILKQSASAGCRLCTVLWGAVCRHHGGEEEYKRILGSSKRDIKTPLLRLWIPAVDEPSTIYFSCGTTQEPICLGISAYPGTQASQMIYSRPTAVDPTSNESISLLKTWIAECFNQHKECLGNADSALPKRVLYVGKPGVELDHPLRLYCDGGFGPYVTLSHCWGGLVPFQTTKGTLEERKSEILFSDLPQTFQDAVTITRTLEFEFLWIDSLCIVQDDSQDWATEAANMAKIYRSAILNLSAMSAENSSQGMLLRRDVSVELSCDLDFSDMDKDSLQITYPKPDPGDNIVSSRAWCLQELLLSPRVVHYSYTSDLSQRQMIWQCQQLSLREDGRTGIHLFNWFNKALLKYPSSPDRSLFTKWWRIVKEYSGRRLTVASDKLPAISGVANAFNSQLSNSQSINMYLAGIWRQNLTRDLLWRASARGQVTKPRSYIAPSWSWASIQGSVFFGIEMSSDLESHVEIIDANVTLTSPDPYGAVSGGYIRVCGYLKPARFRLDCNWRWRPGSNLFRYIEVAEKGTTKHKATGGLINRYECHVHLDQDDAGFAGSQAWCLRFVDPTSDVWSNTSAHGLVLRQTERVEVFERIGVYCLYNAYSSLKELDNWFEDVIERRFITIV